MRQRWVFPVLAAACVAALAVPGYGQSYRQQGITPIFDGWEELPDGSRLFYFGYINRSTAAVTIPIGAANEFSPAPGDRGQPTSFLPGRHEHMFTLKAPDKNAKFVWTLNTAIGPQTANASFDQLYILEERENEDPNAKAPAIKAGDVVARTGEPVRLAPVVQPATGGREVVVEGAAAEAAGLNVTWSKYRGPGAVTLSDVPGTVRRPAAGGRGGRESVPTPGVFTAPCGDKPAAGCGSVIARFSAPGEYVLRAAARQERMQGLAFIRVTVSP